METMCRSRVVRLLHDSGGKFKPVAMIREEAQREKFDAMGVHWVLGDVAEGPLEQHMQNVDAVIFAAGAGRARGPLKQVSWFHLHHLPYRTTITT